MIISKKKLNEKIREALEQQERERWVYEKIDRVERDCAERIDNLNRHLCELDRRVSVFMEDQNRNTKGV